MITVPQLGDENRCVPILVRLAREMHVEAEQLRARELLRQAAATWDGPGGGGCNTSWWKGLAEAGGSLGIRSKIADLTLAEALHLCQDGAFVITQGSDGDDLTLIVGFDGKTARIAVGDVDECEHVSARRLQEMLKMVDQRRGRWLIVDATQEHQAADDLRHPAAPLQRLLGIVRPESNDIWIVVVFAFFVGILNLATPIAVEALVNTVAFGRFLQPVIVLSLMLMAFLSFAAAVLGLQTFVVEIIQRRLFARVAADLAYRLPRVRHDAWDSNYGPELANRFFDVVTLQKVSAHLLLDGVAIALSTLVGMAVLGFYHPWLLGFDVLLLALVVAGIWVLGRGAISSGIEESKFKYRLAGWLEDIARCPRTFKLNGASDFAADRANFFASQYLSARRRHFRILFRQVLFVLGLQAVAGTVLLGFGGWLVIQGQLTLGQLVAAELIVAAILGSLAKLGKHLEGYYDLLAGVDKLGKLFDLPLERHDGLLEMHPDSDSAVRATDVQYKVAESAVLGSPLHLELAPGERLAVTGPPGAGKSGFLELLYGLRRPSRGHVEIFNVDPADVRPDVLRRHVCLVGRHELFEGTVAENVHVHRPGVGLRDVRDVLRSVGLLEDILRLPGGLETEIISDGNPLSENQKTTLLLARAFAGNPQILLIDGLLDRLPDEALNHVLATLERLRDRCTLVIATGRRAVEHWCDRSLVLTRAAQTPSGNGRASPRYET